MKFHHETLPSFWSLFNDLPEDIRNRAQKQFELVQLNPSHSIQLKPVGKFWAARVTDAYLVLDRASRRYDQIISRG